eukprot:5191322-Prymnesium_polylepis.1
MRPATAQPRPSIVGRRRHGGNRRVGNARAQRDGDGSARPSALVDCRHYAVGFRAEHVVRDPTFSDRLEPRVGNALTLRKREAGVLQLLQQLEPRELVPAPPVEVLPGLNFTCTIRRRRRRVPARCSGASTLK